MKKLLFVMMISLQLMSSNINWSFPPTTLSTASVNATTPHVAIDLNGNVVAVWVENGVVKAATQPVGMNWSSAVSLSGSGASLPRIVSDSNGNATAVWIQGGAVKAATKTLTGNWSSAVTVASGTATSPSLAVDGAGDVVAVWVSNGTVETATKLFGSNWGNSTSINNTGNSATLPHVVIGGSGSNTRAVIAWHSATSPTNIVYTSTKLISSGSWSTAQALSSTSQQAGYAHVAVDSNGNATAVWFSYNLTGTVYSSVVVESASRPASGSWSSSVPVSSAGMYNPAGLLAHVAYDASGNAVALWNTSFDGETFTIQSATNPVYGSWAAPTTLVSGGLYSLGADLAVTSLGDALAVFMFYNGAAQQIQSSELDSTGFINSGWSVPQNVSTGTQNAYPNAAATLTGNVINTAAVWIDYNGTFTSIAASTGSKTVVSPPSSLAVTQSNNNFGAFTEYYNTLSWQASTSQGVVGYLIYRNGVFLQQVASNVLQIVDHNQAQTGPVTYGVAAVDGQQSHSQIVTITH